MDSTESEHYNFGGDSKRMPVHTLYDMTVDYDELDSQKGKREHDQIHLKPPAPGSYIINSREINRERKGN